MLSNTDVMELREIRHALHRAPEISGEERETARAIVAYLTPFAPDKIVTDLGGHGVAAVYEGAQDGPTLLFRCELDALPIQETPRAHESQTPGKAHLCGHDGHMTIMLGLARLLHRKAPARGRVVLMFQPAEETGVGGPAVVADPRFAPLKPDLSFSLHNSPGMPLGQVGLTTGAVSAASRGMEIVLAGHSSHAAEPEEALSPRLALAKLMQDLPSLAGPRADDYAMVTITHANMGAPTFGITPGNGTLFATLRTGRDETMAALVADAEQMAHAAATADGLTIEINYHDVFEHTENAPEAVDILRIAMDTLAIPHGEDGGVITPSEDFSAFTKIAPGAMLFLGAGEDCTVVHHPDYDFPDDLIPIGAHLFERVVRDQLG
ncbi:amidohydrolase [Primorskyibacter sp. S187A]|uniref:amidohydrolase n=1 Tax=Primorskyibacter sp. S187A TaxID=3415130 RepID=UPI003C7E5BD3